MKRGLILFLLFAVCLSSLFSQNADSLSLPLPQFLNPFYDSFSRNYFGAAATGRGYSGAAYLGDVAGVALNPAALLPDSTQLSVELNLKPPLQTFGYPSYAQYSSRLPFAMASLSGKLGEDISASIVYSLPKSIYLDDFSMIINQGADIIQRFPAYYLYQFSLNAAYHKPRLHLGLNIHNQIHYIDDPIFLHTYERVRNYKYALRVQPGIVLGNEKLSLGVSAMPPNKFKWDLKYAEYDVLQPLWVNAGINYRNGLNRYLMDAEYEQFSRVCDEYSDRLILKAGYERDLGRTVYRLGYLYSGEVYSGIVRLPANPNATIESSYWWGSVRNSLNIGKNEQHFITGGLSHYHRYGTVNLAVMQVVAGEASQLQFVFSLSFYINSLRQKGFRNFDD
ncbi:MAG: hypothetical protein PHY48_00770 [Candidatus Cloacimonetes bacterium]|nr:hypothetical protein [Candidatus Cloacimonadota bacterium]